METFLKILLAVLGIGLLLDGIQAIKNLQATASADFEEKRPYSGGPALVLGILWVFLGFSVLYANFAPDHWPVVGTIRELVKLWLS